MVTLIFKINGQQIPEPANYKELSIDLSFDSESPSPALSTNQWDFQIDSSVKPLEHLKGGLTGGVGVFEGLPFNIEIYDPKTNERIVFEQYLDMTDDPVLTRDSAIVSSQEVTGINWINDVADGFTYQYLYEETSLLNDSHFVSVPYVINSVPNYKDAMLAIVSTTVVSFQLADAFGDLTAESIRALDPFSSIGAVLVLAFRIIRVIALLITLIKLIKDIIDLLIQPVKYHKGMYVKDLFEIGCKHLGLTFKSTILTSAPMNKLFILPSKFDAPLDQTDEDQRMRGFLEPSTDQTGYFDGTFGDLIRAMKLMFNAKVIPVDGELWFVREDHSFNTAQLKIPKIRPCDYSINSDELKSNYLIKFQTDTYDKNTITEYKGTIIKAQHEAIRCNNRKMKLLKGVENVNIPFALAKRKTELNIVEKIVMVFLDVASAILNTIIFVANAVIPIVNAIGKIIKLVKKVLNFFGVKTEKLKAPEIKKITRVDFGEILNDRIGMLKLEFDDFNNPKIFLLNESSDPRNTKMPENNNEIISARYLWENYHIISSFAPYPGNENGNQWFRYSASGLPFCFHDFLKVKNNNSIFDEEGNPAKVESIRWNVWNQTADIDYRVNQKYTNNLKVTLHEPKGY